MKFGEVEEFIRGAAKEESGNSVEADGSENLCVCGNWHLQKKQNKKKKVFILYLVEEKRKGTEIEHDTRMRNSRLEGGLEEWQVEEGLGRVLSQTVHTM